MVVGRRCGRGWRQGSEVGVAVVATETRKQTGVTQWLWLLIMMLMVLLVVVMLVLVVVIVIAAVAVAVLAVVVSVVVVVVYVPLSSVYPYLRGYEVDSLAWVQMIGGVAPTEEGQYQQKHHY